MTLCRKYVRSIQKTNRSIVNEPAMIKNTLKLLVITLYCGYTVTSFANEWSGYVSGEYRGFVNDGLPEQENNYLSFATEPEYYHQWQNGKNSFTFKGFARIDQYDEERTHADIRELNWLGVGESWELRVGIGKVFWGVTESQHLVDVINQTDAVENLDLEDKLGQPMIDLALIRDWGTLNFFVLPGFRQRTFPGVNGRLRTIPVIDTAQTRYEASNGNKHTDLALRWSHYVGDWDFGLSHFWGTNRQPILNSIGFDDSGNPVLIPYYEIINQTGLDVQTVMGDWLLKLEYITRQGSGNRFHALTTGFEYTFVGIFESILDLGLISEYLYDSRDKDISTPFQNDIMLGSRLTFNDEQSTEFLLGMIVDADDGETFYNLEASRRLGEAWKINVEARVFSNISQNSPLFSIRNDDYISIDLAWYF